MPKVLLNGELLPNATVERSDEEIEGRHGGPRADAWLVTLRMRQRGQLPPSEGLALEFEDGTIKPVVVFDLRLPGLAAEILCIANMDEVLER